MYTLLHFKLLVLGITLLNIKRNLQLSNPFIQGQGIAKVEASR